MAKKLVCRQFDAAFKVEAVRRTEKQQAVGVLLPTIAHFLYVRPELLSMWASHLEDTESE